MKASDENLKQLHSSLKLKEKQFTEALDQLETKELFQKKVANDIVSAVSLAEKETKDLVCKVKNVEDELEKCNDRINELKESNVKLAEQALFVSQRDNSICDLLKTVTQTRFKNVQPDDILQGLVVRESDIEPFSINLKNKSQKEVVDQLWSQLNEDTKFMLA